MNKTHYEKLIEAAGFFSKILRKAVASENGLHAETLIAAASRMAGTMLFRSFSISNTDIAPGTAYLSEQADSDGPKLVKVMLATLEKLGHKLNDQSFLNVGTVSIQLSQLTLLQTQRRLDPFYLSYCDATSLQFSDAAYASAISTGLLIHDCRQIIDVGKAASMAVNGMVEGVKTFPLPICDIVRTSINLQ